MTHLIRVGNSLGVRIPKAIIAQAGFKEEMALSFKVTDKGLLIAPMKNCREGWLKAFSGPEIDPEDLMGDTIGNQFDEEEWEW